MILAEEMLKLAQDDFTSIVLSAANYQHRKDEITIYPNPVSDEFKIETDRNILNTIIYDMKGCLVKRYAGKESSLDMAYLQKGIYIISIQLEDRVINRRLIKE